MNPLLLAWNFRPEVCAFGSLESDAPVGVPSCQMLHGHTGPAVVKLHEYGPLIGVPEAFCAPDTVAVYVTPAASGFVGVNVATVFPLLKLTVPATLFPPESTTVNDIVLVVTACENVAVGAADAATPVAPELGVTPVTDGGVLGVTALDGDDAGPVPTELVADTVNVYAVPLVRPLTVAGVPVAVTDVCAVDPMYGVTV